MVTRKLHNASLVALAALATALGCSSQDPETPKSPPGTVKLQAAGSTFVAPLFKKWFEQYQQEHPETTIDYAAVGSGEGTKRFLAETVDFGASDAALTDEQIASVKRGAILVPMTAGIIVLAYNPEGMPPHLKLPRDVYPDIFLGKITQWDDPRIAAANPDVKLPSKSIAVVARQDSSGTTFAFTNHLTAASEDWKKGPGAHKSVGWPEHVRLAPGNEGVAAQIQRNPGAIGYLEYGIAKNIHLGMATLQNKAGSFVAPSGTSGLDTLIGTKMPANLRVFMPDPDGADSYPIVTYSWLLMYGKYDDAKKLAALKDVLHWCLDEGQQYSESLGYLRLAPDVVKLATKAVDSSGK